MSQANRTANNVGPVFHPASHYNSPDDVLGDFKLSTDEKRVLGIGYVHRRIPARPS
jgi:hypothetical protein